ncbi:MAG: glycosyltransferase family 4 protein [Terriglobales bacterium]
MEVVHADFSRVWRGGQQQLLLLARELRALGCTQTVVARRGVVAQRLREAGFAVLAPGGLARRQARRAAIVHAHEGHAHSWMLRTLWRGQARQVLSRRVAFAIRNPVSRWKYRQLDLVIAVSEAVRRQARSTGLAQERIVVIPDGIALEDLPAAGARARVRARCGIPDEAPGLVCVSALTEEKGVGDALLALARLPALWLLLAGTGPQLGGLRRLARELGCENRVVWGGGEFTPAEWVAAGDVLLMPSREEGLGSAALVAMAMERPVVATRTGGIPELVEDGVSGLLAPVGDIAALAAQCARLFDDATLAARVRQAARLRVERQFTAARVAAATVIAYQSLLAVL